MISVTSGTILNIQRSKFIENESFSLFFSKIFSNVENKKVETENRTQELFLNFKYLDGMNVDWPNIIRASSYCGNDNERNQCMKGFFRVAVFQFTRSLPIKLLPRNIHYIQLQYFAWFLLTFILKYFWHFSRLFLLSPI